MRPNRYWLAVLVVTATSASAERKPRVPPQPKNWKAGVTVKAFAQGPAAIVRDFTWGQDRDPANGVLRFSVTDNTWEETEASQDTLGE
jgi:hypothetical protein